VAVALSQLGKSVLVLDADLGLANVDVLLGLKSGRNLSDVIEGRCKLEDVMLTGPGGIQIIPAASGVDSLLTLEASERTELLKAVETVAQRFDYLLIDTSAGIGSDVVFFNAAASEVVFVVNPEPTSLTDSYALMKVLRQRQGRSRFSMIANRVKDQAEARACHRKLADAATRFLSSQVELVGSLPEDALGRQSVQEQCALALRYPSSGLGLAYARVAAAIDGQPIKREVHGGVQMFFEQLLELPAYDA
jgi:flagellar biosynthesis protein FlhG